MKRIEIKKLIPYVSITLMCMSLSACSQNTTATEVSSEVVSDANSQEESSQEHTQNLVMQEKLQSELQENLIMLQQILQLTMEKFQFHIQLNQLL